MIISTSNLITNLRKKIEKHLLKTFTTMITKKNRNYNGFKLSSTHIYLNVQKIIRRSSSKTKFKHYEIMK
jgi:hypothetical protein